MVFRKIAEWLSGTKKTDQPHPLDGPIRAAEEKTFAPYKLEPPAPAPVAETKPVEAVNAIAEPARCGCGRSPTGLCVGLHKLTTEEWSAHADNPNRVVTPVVQITEPVVVKAEEPKKERKKSAAVIKKPASEKKAPAKKPAAKKAPAKKPATKKKASTVAQVPARKTATRKSK